jgi:uncharacterized membrane protein
MHHRKSDPRFIATLLGSLLASLSMSCAAALPPEPTLADARRAQLRWDDASLEQLQQGLGVLQQRCSKCHRAPTPDSVTSTSWSARIDAMQDRAGLPAAERVMLERYLIIVADRPPSASTGRMQNGQPVISPPPVRQVPPYNPMR